ncbi:virion-associated protein [Dregea volubilis virus 2]|nr:virion-associated protein [Dregea volubilis virus 2]
MSGKIDMVYEEMLRMESRFTKLEQDQQRHFEEALEKASASILAELRKEIRRKEEPSEVIPSIISADLIKTLEELLDQIRKEAQECHCNKAILEAIKGLSPATGPSPSEKGKEIVEQKKKPTKGTGRGVWYGENLNLPYNPWTREPDPNFDPSKPVNPEIPDSFWKPK